MKELILKVNNELRSVYVESNEILLDVLREKLGIKSPKCGCERGDCGACTVLLDGKAVRSCLVRNPLSSSIPFNAGIVPLG